MGRFSPKKRKNCSKNSTDLATSGRHNSAMITNAEISYGPPTGCPVSILKVRINSESYPWSVRCVQENISGKD